MLWASSAAVLLCPGAAGAEDQVPSCGSPQVTVEGVLDERWIEPLTRLCERLANGADVDRSARLRVVTAGSDVIIEATLSDGRTTLRRVRSPDDLQLTVEALTTVPQVIKPISLPAAPVARDPARAPVATRSLSPVADHLTLEGGGAIFGRVELAPTYATLGAEGYAGLRFARSYIGLTLRWDAAETPTGAGPPSFEMETFGAGVLFARRLPLSAELALDVGPTALLLLQTQSSQVDSTETVDTEADLRLGLLTRAVVGQSAWRWTFSVEAEVSPPRLRRHVDSVPGFPALPIWTLGLGLGALWEAT